MRPGRVCGRLKLYPATRKCYYKYHFSRLDRNVTCYLKYLPITAESAYFLGKGRGGNINIANYSNPSKIAYCRSGNLRLSIKSFVILSMRD